MSNMELAAGILRSCWRLGVREIVLCAGARNAPFVTILSEENPFHVFPFFEERSAGFFALGKMQALNRPVVVITTSGTAAAELLPAAIEADYQGLPLIILSCDRPRRYRGSGAPQTINQIGLYSHYVEKTWDIEGICREELEFSLRRPAHINVCFDEPLIDGEVKSLDLAEFTPAPRTEFFPDEYVALKAEKPLIVVGGLPAGAGQAIVKALRQWKRPALIESPSNLRGHPELSEIEILGGEKSLAQIDYDGVIRIGSVPTLRLWRDLENASCPVAHFSHLPFSGLPRERVVFPLLAISTLRGEFRPWTNAERTADQQRASSQRALLRKYSQSEPAWVEWLSRNIPSRARVFIGNSLPIREWDFAAVRDGGHEIFANRGVNGIDGLISTFQGLAHSENSNWCVIGDLSALYDLSGPWPNRQQKIRDLNLVIINNGGGKIFHRLFHNVLFENQHDLNFKAWAEMWGWDYQRLEQPKKLEAAVRPRVIEIAPSNEQTENFWRAVEAIP